MFKAVRAIDVRVNAVLTSGKARTWTCGWPLIAAQVNAVEIDPSGVTVHGKHPYLSAPATATATRQRGQLADALNDAFHRLHTEGGGC